LGAGQSLSRDRASEKSESIKTVAKGKNAEVVAKEIRQYRVEDHFKLQWDRAKTLYELISQRILELDSAFTTHPVKAYISFNIQGKNVVIIKIRQSKLRLELLRTRPEDLKDPEKRVRYMEKSFEHFNQYISLFDIENEDDIDYAIMLIK